MHDLTDPFLNITWRSTLIVKEGNILFNGTLNTFYLRLYGIRHMVKDHLRGNPLCHRGYSFQLAARVLLYVSSQRQDNTYHILCYTSSRALAGTRNRSQIVRHKTCCCHFMGYSIWLAAMGLICTITAHTMAFDTPAD